MSETRFKVPHTLVLLFGMVVLALLLTYVLPAGTFDRVETADGHMQVVAGSFELTPDSERLSPLAVFTAIPQGFSEAEGIIFFVFIIGGCFAVLLKVHHCAMDGATGTQFMNIIHDLTPETKNPGKPPPWIVERPSMPSMLS